MHSKLNQIVVGEILRSSYITSLMICLHSPSQKQGVCHTGGLAIYTKKYLRAKEELWKLKYFTMQKYNLQKILYKKPKSFQTL
jgi:hypothetical protein